MPRPQKDIRLLFSTRILRLFCYGFLSVVLALYLAQAGLPEQQIGLLFTLTLAGDAGVSLWLTTSADRFGRRRTLVVGALLMAGAGAVFILTRVPLLLMLAAIIGVMSPSGNEIGPFLSVEQAALTQLISDEKRTQTFAWYNLAGSFATATGALSGGWLAQGLQAASMAPLASYRVVLMGYALGGATLGILFLFLSAAVEAPAASRTSGVTRTLGLHRSRRVVFQLSALFSLDAFAGGLIVQSLVAYWFHIRFGVEPGIIGSIFFGANVLAGISALLAGRLAKRIGLINTMVFTHIPSNVLLMLVPLMPNLALAVGVLCCGSASLRWTYRPGSHTPWRLWPPMKGRRRRG
jgi:MFS family permease